MDFELPEERFTDSGWGDQDIGRRNLMEVEDRIHAKMQRFASEVGGKYIAPTASEVVTKVNSTLDVNPNVFYSVDQDEYIWTPGGKFGVGGGNNVENYNKSGSFGFIVCNSEEGKEKGEKTLRLYRGCEFDPKVKQVAPLARLDGVSTQDIYNYVDRKESMDDIVSKVTDEHARNYLQYSLANIRKRAEENGDSELDEIKWLHTAFTSGALDIDLWVSAAYEPSKTYGHGNMGNIYGDFITKRGMQAVLIMDVPESKVQKYSNEAGILGEIEPEYIKVIVPVSGNTSAVVRRAERYIEGMREEGL